MVMSIIKENCGGSYHSVVYIIWGEAGTHLQYYDCVSRAADFVDVIYVNIVTWSMGCVGVGKVAKGEQ